jgi:hypothetical protein
VALEPLRIRRVGDESGDRLAQLLLRAGGIVRLEDARLRLHHLPERPEADALAVRERAALTPSDQLRPLLQALEQLPDEPALADAGDADERGELRLVLATHAVDRGEERLQLVRAADERRASDLAHVDAQASLRLERRPDADRLHLPLGRDLAPIAVRDRALRRTERCLVDEDPVLGRRRLQARRRVDDVARGHALAAIGSRADGDERLAGGDADAYLELAIFGIPLADRECRSYGALGIVLVRDRRAEERHHGVSDELLDRAPEALEVSTDALVVPGEERAHVLRVHPLGLRRGADEVAEEDGHYLPFLSWRRRFL